MSMNPFKKILVLLTVIIGFTTALAVAPASAATTVTVNSGGDLVINGGNGAEDVTLRRESSGSLFVHVNDGGGSASYDVGSDWTRDVVVNLRGGDDSFRIQVNGSRFQLHRDLRVNLGSGSNTFGASFIGVTRNLKVTDGSGSSSFVLTDLDVDGNATYSLGAGAHDVSSIFNNTAHNYQMTTTNAGSVDLHASYEYVGRTYRLTTGNLNDDVNFEYRVRINGAATIDLRGGEDTLNILEESEFDDVSTIRLGSGEDVAHFRQTHFTGDSTILTGGQDDRLTLFGNHFSSDITANGGSGTDQITGESNRFDEVTKILSFEIQ